MILLMPDSQHRIHEGRSTRDGVCKIESRGRSSKYEKIPDPATIVFLNMSNGNYFGSFRLSFSGGNVMNSMKYISTIIPVPTYVANTYDNIFQNDKSLFMFECFLFYRSWMHLTFAIFTFISSKYPGLLAYALSGKTLSHGFPFQDAL
jgi:hypothetical protein